MSTQLSRRSVMKAAAGAALGVVATPPFALAQPTAAQSGTRTRPARSGTGPPATSSTSGPPGSATTFGLVYMDFQTQKRRPS